MSGCWLWVVEWLRVVEWLLVVGGCGGCWMWVVVRCEWNFTHLDLMTCAKEILLQFDAQGTGKLILASMAYKSVVCVMVCGGV